MTHVRLGLFELVVYVEEFFNKKLEIHHRTGNNIKIAEWCLKDKYYIDPGQTLY